VFLHWLVGLTEMNVKLLAKMIAQLLWVILCLFQITSGISNPFLLTKLSVLVYYIFMITRCGSLWLMPGVAIAFHDFQVAVVTNQVEYEKQRNYGLSVVKCHLMCVPPPPPPKKKSPNLVTLFFWILCFVKSKKSAHLIYTVAQA